MNRKRLLIVHAAVAAAVAAVMVLWYFSPDLSWSASIRDSDGDGFSDGEDLYPDGDCWAEVSIDYYEEDYQVEPPGYGDPYFVIAVDLNQDGLWEVLDWSQTYRDVLILNSPFSVQFDVPESMTPMTVNITVYDDSPASPDPIIDCTSTNPGSILSFVVQPPTGGAWLDNGGLDNIGYEPDCVLHWSVSFYTKL